MWHVWRESAYICIYFLFPSSWILKPGLGNKAKLRWVQCSVCTSFLLWWLSCQLRSCSDPLPQLLLFKLTPRTAPPNARINTSFRSCCVVVSQFWPLNNQTGNKSQTTDAVRKKKDKDLNNYRPIYKVLTKVLTKRLEKTLDENQPQEQAGFRADTQRQTISTS